MSKLEFNRIKYKKYGASTIVIGGASLKLGLAYKKTIHHRSFRSKRYI